MINVIKIQKKTGYLENDPMGGDESYSASKGSAELLINSYIKSYFFLKKIRFLYVLLEQVTLLVAETGVKID